MSPPELIELSPSIYSLFLLIASEEFFNMSGVHTQIPRSVLQSKIESKSDLT
jgi:hypothetical protein